MGLLKDSDRQNLLDEFEKISEIYKLFKAQNFTDLILNVVKDEKEAIKNPQFNSIFAKLLTKISGISELYQNVLKEKIDLQVIKDVLSLSFEDSLKLDNSVNLLTFFKTAGLEFKHVYIPSLTEKAFPKPVKATYFISSESNEVISSAIREISPNFRHLIESDKESIEEEARLFYLGMTRAKESLTISTYNWAEKKQIQPSVFFELLAKKDCGNYEAVSKTIGEDEEEFTLEENASAEVQKEVVVKDKLTLNPSAITNFLSCPKKYYCKNLLNLGEESVFAANYGNIVHAILELFVKKYLKSYTKETILDLGKILFDSKIEIQKAIDTGFKQLDKLELKETVINYAKSVTQTVFNISKAKNTLSLIQIYYKLVNSIKPYENLAGIEQYNAELNLRVFEKIVIDYMQSESYVSVKKFLEYIEKATDDKSFELPNLLIKDVDAVQIYTIYASKGLQFPYTFIAHITSHRNPDNSNISFDLQYGKKPGFGIIINKYKGKGTAKATIYKEIWKNPRLNNEDLRLFYVAVSRAEHYVNVLSFTPCGSYPASYIKEMSEAYHSEPFDTTALEVEPQEYKPSLTLSKQKPKENIKAFESSKSEYNMSFSRVNTFSDCRAKYLFQYKYKYPKLGIKEDSSIVGSVVHNLIYTSFLNNKEFSVTEIPLFLQTIELEKQDAIKIKNLYDSFLKSDFAPSKLNGKKIFAERSFNFSTEIKGNVINFSGDIDLLVQNKDGSYTVIDFKTNKDIEKSLGNYYKQLYLYKKALEKEGLKIKDSKIINLTQDEPKTFEMSEEMLLSSGEIFEKDVENLISADLEGEILKKDKDDSCKSCGYGYLCQMNE